MRVEMKNVQFSFHKNSESLLKNHKFCTAQGTLYVLKMGEVCACGGGGGDGERGVCEAQNTRWCELLGV